MVWNSVTSFTKKGGWSKRSPNGINHLFQHLQSYGVPYKVPNLKGVFLHHPLGILRVFQDGKPLYLEGPRHGRVSADTAPPLEALFLVMVLTPAVPGAPNGQEVIPAEWWAKEVASSTAQEVFLRIGLDRDSPSKGSFFLWRMNESYDFGWSDPPLTSNRDDPKKVRTTYPSRDEHGTHLRATKNHPTEVLRGNGASTLQFGTVREPGEWKRGLFGQFVGWLDVGDLQP